VSRRVWATLLFALVLGALGGPGRADDVPDLKTLHAKMADARGAEPENYREVVTARAGQLSVRAQYLVRDHDHRSVFDVGPVHTEEGTVNGDRWHQNANGLTIFDGGGPLEEAKEKLTTTVTHVSTPFDAYVISELNPRKRGTRTYVDPKTFLVRRKDEIDAYGTAVIVYDDFRRFGDRMLSGRWTMRNGAGAVIDFERTEYVVGSVSPDDVAEPPIRRRLVNFPTGVGRVALPVQIKDHRIYIRVTVGTRNLDFLLDTGSAGIAIEAGTAHQLGLAFYNKSRSIDAVEHDSYDAVVPSMSVGPLAMKDVAVGILPDPLDQRQGIKVVGLLGFDFLATLGVTIDYELAAPRGAPQKPA
jgi:hypothetical protein